MMNFFTLWEPDFLYYSLWNSTGAFNYRNIKDPMIDELTEKARGAVDPAARAEIYKAGAEARSSTRPTTSCCGSATARSARSRASAASTRSSIRTARTSSSARSGCKPEPARARSRRGAAPGPLVLRPLSGRRPAHDLSSQPPSVAFALTLFLISVITFAVTNILPGDVATMIMGTAEQPDGAGRAARDAWAERSADRAIRALDRRHADRRLG